MYGLQFYIFMSNEDMTIMSDLRNGHIFNVFIYYELETGTYKLATLTSIQTGYHYNIVSPLEIYRAAHALDKKNEVAKLRYEALREIDTIMESHQTI